MSRPSVEELMKRRSEQSFDDILENLIRERRPSPEELAGLLGCGLATLRNRLKGRPVRVKRCLEWID